MELRWWRRKRPPHPYCDSFVGAGWTPDHKMRWKCRVCGNVIEREPLVSER